MPFWFLGIIPEFKSTIPGFQAAMPVLKLQYKKCRILCPCNFSKIYLVEADKLWRPFWTLALARWILSSKGCRFLKPAVVGGALPWSDECLNCVKPVVPVTTMSGAEFRFSKGCRGGGSLVFLGLVLMKGDDSTRVMAWASCKNVKFRFLCMIPGFQSTIPDFQGAFPIFKYDYGV